MVKFRYLFHGLLLCSIAVGQTQQGGEEYAQHQHAPPPAQEPAQQTKQKEPPPAGEPQPHDQMAGMSPSAESTKEPHRMASGTAWQPDSTPAYMWMT
ncbi:MAG: hypothetical protein ACRD3A_07360, partial [Terriglobales bacterium]